MRVMTILGGLALAAMVAVPMPAAAGSVSAIAGAPILTNPALPAPPRVPPALVGRDPGIYQRGSLNQDRPHDRHRPGSTTVVVVPQPIYVSPNRCWYPGYWSYQWVPQWAAYSAWVDGGVAPDGEWMAGHYESRWYPSGSYQPYWVEGYWDGCS
jgi:hypothetical protein